MRWTGQAAAVLPAATPDVYWPGAQLRGSQPVAGYVVSPGEEVQVVGKLAQPPGSGPHEAPMLRLRYAAVPGELATLDMASGLAFGSCPQPAG